MTIKTMDEKKSLVLRLSIDRAHELAPGLEAVEAPPAGAGLTRIYIASVEDLSALAGAFAEAATAQIAA